MSTTELNIVAAQYRQERDSLTEKEKAVRERALWAMAGTDIRKDEMRRDFLKRIIGEDPYVTGARQAILAAGDDADPIWARIDAKQMLLNKGAQLIREARKTFTENGGNMSAAIRDVLQKYDALPYVRMVNGIPFRVGYVKGKQPAATAASAEPEEPPQFQKFDTGKSREFWANFRSTVSSYLETQCDGIDPSTREILKRDFETDMKVIIDQFLSVVRREQGRGKSHAAIASVALTRAKVFEACEVLHMDPPQADGIVDMDKARRQKKLLARAYHPDSNGGDDTTQDKYVAVIQAYQTLETYSKQFNAGNRPHRGEGES